MRVRDYALELDIDYAAEAFQGRLTVGVDDAADPFELDSADLAIDGAWIGDDPRPFRVDADRQKVVVDLGGARPPAVRIAYHGKARRDVLNGLYVSKFGDRKLLTTMMEPVGCRRLLPCADTPDQKAVFRLTVRTDSDLTVISNAEVADDRPDGAQRRWTFAPTPPMSTYLLYLGVGPFETRELVHGGIRIVAASAPGKGDLARPALEMAGPLLAAYGDYYGLRYPLPKMHLVAVPDLWAGGMENWGAIVIPELGLHWGPATSPSVVRWAVETLAHEIAHQWFGDLVTMRSFDDLWLSESFATFVAAKMEERLRLRSDPWAEFVIRTAPGYFSDSLAATHPVQMRLHDPAEISQSTDDITYYKGANIVRMLEAHLGEDVFRKGLRAYLDRFQLDNATGPDLWDALEAASAQPVRRVMLAWVERAGFPVIEVRRQDDRLALRQRRFTFLPDASVQEPWPIPLGIVDNGRSRQVLFDAATSELDLPAGDGWRLNPGRTSFVRVWYDPAVRARLLPQLLAWPAIDRWAFVNDADAFLLAGSFSVAEYLEVVRSVRTAADYPTVSDVATGLRRLWVLGAHRHDVRDAYLDFFRTQFDRLGLEARPGEPDTDPILRQFVVIGLVRTDDAFAARMAERFPGIDSAPAALRPAIVLARAQQGGPSTVDALYARLTNRESTDAAEQAAFAMEGLPDEASLRDALDRALASEVRPQALEYLIEAIAANPYGRAAVWAWELEHLREYERRTEGSWMLSNLLQRTIPIVGLGREAEVRAFFAQEAFPEGANGVRKGLELLTAYRGLVDRLASE